MKRLVILLPLLFAGCFGDPQKSDFGLDAIDSMQTPADPAPTCIASWPAAGATVGDPATQAKRDACTFGPGDDAKTTLGVDPSLASAIPIRHVIVMMKENRSFDHLLGKLHDVRPDVDAVPASYVNPDLSGTDVAPFHATTTCISPDPGHQSQSMITGWDEGKMDGFVKNAAQTTDTDGHYVMAYYDQTDLPLYYWLAQTWALNQRHFAPVVSGTYSNRNFMYFGDNAGAVDTGIVFPPPSTPSILHLLMNAGFTWGAYCNPAPNDLPLSGSLDLRAGDPGVHTLDELYQQMDNGTLPNVVFVDGDDGVDDDHPVADLQKGEAWVKKLYDHAVASPQWPTMAIIWVYDEGGGFPDHVAPDTACRSHEGSPFTQRGPRVPLVVISPWARMGYTSNVTEDHTAITRFIETVFGLPALTGRDANSTALLDLFDFSCPAPSFTAPAAPAPGTGGCANPP